MARSRDELVAAYDDAVAKLERDREAAIARKDRAAYDKAMKDARATVGQLRAEAKRGKR